MNSRAPALTFLLIFWCGLPVQAQDINVRTPDVLDKARSAKWETLGASIPIARRDPSPVAADHTVAFFYVIPSDIEFEQSVLDRTVEATRDVQAWYQCATGGVTWELAFPEIVRVYFADRTRQEYVDGGYYGPILDEMRAKGLPVLTPGSVAALWARGAGFFAGANPACDGQCGVLMVGVEVFPEFNNPEWSGGTCPPGEGVAAFPCTPLGAMAHELGHALASLPHPFDVPETRDVAFHSVMQSHWNYPSFAGAAEKPWGFLTLERQQLRASPFLKKDIALNQSHDCEVLNLPEAGPVPVAGFQERVRDQTVQLRNQTGFQSRQPKNGALYYWTFGDGTATNDDSKRLVHRYAEPGTYTIVLRASGKESVVDLLSRQITVSGTGETSVRAPER
jgi:hypothetical protein